MLYGLIIFGKHERAAYFLVINDGMNLRLKFYKKRTTFLISARVFYKPSFSHLLLHCFYISRDTS